MSTQIKLPIEDKQQHKICQYDSQTKYTAMVYSFNRLVLCLVLRKVKFSLRRGYFVL